MYVPILATCMYGNYRIAGNFRREIFSEISEMLYTFQKYNYFQKTFVFLLATSDYSNSVATYVVASSNIPKFYFRNDSFIQISENISLRKFPTIRYHVFLHTVVKVIIMHSFNIQLPESWSNI